jgi:hypothetical protein
MLRPMVGRPVCLSVKPQLGPKTRFLLLSDSCGFVAVWRPLWRQDGSVVYNCCWPLPAKSFSGPSPAGLLTIFYCLKLETPQTWRTRSPHLYHEQGGPLIPPGTGFPFRRLLRLAELLTSTRACDPPVDEPSVYPKPVYRKLLTTISFSQNIRLNMTKQSKHSGFYMHHLF